MSRNESANLCVAADDDDRDANLAYGTRQALRLINLMFINHASEVNIIDSTSYQYACYSTFSKRSTIFDNDIIYLLYTGVNHPPLSTYDSRDGSSRC
jgi:hypothetical protein